MNAAAPTSGLNHPPTGVECLLAAARWLVALIFIHWIIVCGRTLAAAARHGSDAPDEAFLVRHFGHADRSRILPRVTRALRRAVALEARLLARRPVEQGFSIEACRAIAVEMRDICLALGMIRGKPTVTRGKRVHPRPTVGAGFKPALAPITPVQRNATGPPHCTPRPRSARERAQHAAQAQTETRVCSWSFSGRAPVFAF